MAPTCTWCGEAFGHGCNTGLCSEACEAESAMAHERAHAGISDPDDCDGPDAEDCPMHGTVAPTVDCAVCGEPKPVSILDAAGQPVCRDCCCECCGEAPDCDCDIGTYDGYDRETGPYSERGCWMHRRSV